MKSSLDISVEDHERLDVKKSLLKTETSLVENWLNFKKVLVNWTIIPHFWQGLPKKCD